MHVVTASTPRTHRAAEDQQRNKRTCAEMVSSLEKKSLQAVVARPTAASKKSYQSGRLFGAVAAHSVRTPSWIVHFKCFSAAQLECREIFVNDVRRVCAPDGGIHVLGTPPLHHHHLLSALPVLSSAPSCDDLLTRLCGIVKVASTAG